MEHMFIKTMFDLFEIRVLASVYISDFMRQYKDFGLAKTGYWIRVGDYFKYSVLNSRYVYVKLLKNSEI